MAAVLIVSSGGAVAEDGWTNIGISDKTNVRYDVRNGSFEVTKTKGDVPIAIVVGRITDPRTSNILVYKWYVPLQACVDKLGTVVSLNVSGEYQFENDFVFGGGNIAAAMGETICGVAEQYFTEINKKSL
ncbi:MAG: hypothetical protein RBR56_09640 [Halothiobacillus sp.]|jgi:hypothetical protein|nr:hypothetical protein [Halothiobacillus sp.]